MTAVDVVADQMTEAEAREITQQIQGAAESLWILLLDAHERRAWNALGYPSWAEYVEAEFDMTRFRSYHLIRAGRVVRAIEEAAGASVRIPHSAHDLEQYAPNLAEVTSEISERVAKGEEPETVVAEVLASPKPRPGTKVYKGKPAAEVLGNVVTTLRAATQTMSGLAMEQFADDAPAEVWIKDIDRTLKELRALRSRLRERYGIAG